MILALRAFLVGRVLRVRLGLRVLAARLGLLVSRGLSVLLGRLVLRGLLALRAIRVSLALRVHRAKRGYKALLGLVSRSRAMCLRLRICRLLGPFRAIYGWFLSLPRHMAGCGTPLLFIGLILVRFRDLRVCLVLRGLQVFRVSRVLPV